MSESRWEAVDRYFGDLLLAKDPALEAALAESEAAGLPEIAVAPNQGALLNLLARAIGARRILEIGTLGGYSTVWLARALPADGKLISLEMSPKHAKVARRNVDNADLSGVVDVRVGRALDLLPGIAAAGEGPFDLVFVDADKPSNPEYFDWAVRLARKGSLIVIDNVVRGGAVADGDSFDPNVKGVRSLAERIAADKRVSATVIQTVGVKGYDGLAIALVL
ncbi:MAG: O-methyltransferase [Bauldia sp.]